MKKLLSLALCCVIAAPALASCAQSAAKNYSPKITVSSSEAEESARYLTNRPQADSEKTKTFKRKIHPLRGWIFIMRQAFSAAYPPSRHGAPTGFYKAASSINPARSFCLPSPCRQSDFSTVIAARRTSPPRVIVT